jgi:hypothetical protein
MTRAALRCALPVIASLVAQSRLAAQSWRTLEVSRQLHDTSAVSVSLSYGAGRLNVRSGAPALLYSMSLRYDAQRGSPTHAFDADSHALRLGVKSQNVRFGDDEKDGDNKSSEMRLELTRSVPLDVSMELGAVEADLNLTGLRISRLRVESGASEARIRFDSLNAVPMSVLEFQVGAASLHVDQLANARAQEIRVRAGVGNVELDLGGQWTQDIDLRVDVALGAASIRVPRDVGLRVDIGRVLASFDHEGLVKRDGAWYSSNWDSAPRKLRIKAGTVFGKFQVDRTGT